MGDIKRLFIGLPIYGSVDPHFFSSFLNLKAASEASGLNRHIYLKTRMGDSAIGRARNGLTREFLESDCSHLLFIDSDLVFSMDHVEQIMSHDEDIVGGFYVKKNEGPVQFVCNLNADSKNERNDGLMSTNYVGTGFLRISRKVFEVMIQEFGKDIWYIVDQTKLKEYDFWHMGVYQYPDGSRRWLSEDWWFCQRAMDIGFKIWIDRAVLLGHSGNAVYPLSYQQKGMFVKPDDTAAAADASVSVSPTAAAA